MTHLYFSKGRFPAYFSATADYIKSVQQRSGAIPWMKDAHLDVWNHVEAAMGLSVTGHYAEAEHAYAWLKKNQLDDGSWWVEYRGGQASNTRKRETNFIAYVATGVWHHYLITEDLTFLDDMWDCVKGALDFVTRYQAPTGEIYWAILDNNEAEEDALITGCSSIYKSLSCGIEIANALGRDATRWTVAESDLGKAICNQPDRFDRTWESKERYSMDWFYPVLAGVIEGADARARLREKWEQFVIDGKGCLCVSDKPWVTVAESSELVFALLAVGARDDAEELFSWLHQWRDGGGGYWTGVVFPERLFWPVEQPTWTAGAVLLAADAITEATPACHLFTGHSSADAAQDTERFHQRQRLEQP